jgi:hypothetical protein
LTTRFASSLLTIKAPIATSVLARRVGIKIGYRLRAAFKNAKKKWTDGGFMIGADLTDPTQAASTLPTKSRNAFASFSGASMAA